MADGVLLFIFWTGDLANFTAGFLRERPGFDVEKDKLHIRQGKKFFQIFLLFLTSLPISDFCPICNSAKFSL
jgi:hypothetical protein